MTLTGLHLLLTYACNYECDHCFVWSSPRQPGTMTVAQIDTILRQARELGTVEWIYFEGGEPFLYHAVLRRGVVQAAAMGFRVGVVSNGYWATTIEDACAWLEEFPGRVQDLSMSLDRYHGDETQRRQVEHAREAARRLGIPCAVISIAEPEASAESVAGQLPGRARAQAWSTFTECPHEDLREPGRVHVDPFGNLHICQGISLGNLFETPLAEICARYDPDAHPITGPLLRGGPAELVRHHGLAHADAYADACHLCDAARHALRARLPEILTPDQMYGPVPA
jgi:MoaA/NifB/PqqE/SkfB family radical SAM enzyme